MYTIDPIHGHYRRSFMPFMKREHGKYDDDAKSIGKKKQYQVHTIIDYFLSYRSCVYTYRTYIHIQFFFYIFSTYEIDVGWQYWTVRICLACYTFFFELKNLCKYLETTRDDFGYVRYSDTMLYNENNSNNKDKINTTKINTK